MKATEILFLTVISITLSLLNPFATLSQVAEDIESLENLLSRKVEAATKFEQTVLEAPASITIISSDDIERYGYQSIEEALFGSRGIFFSNDRIYATFGTRGFMSPATYNNRMLMLVDGHNMNEISYGGVFFGNGLNLATEMIERIEIIRGPASAVYGAGALFGVINIVTKSGKQIDGIKAQGFYGSFENVMGRFSGGYEIGEETDISFSLSLGNNSGQDLYFQNFDSIQYNNGRVINADWENHLGAYSKLKAGKFTAQALFSQRNKGIPGAAYDTQFGLESSSHDSRSFLEARYEDNIAHNLTLKTRIFHDSYYYKGVYPTNTTENNDDESIANWQGAEISTIWDIAENNRLNIGFEYLNVNLNEYNLMYKINQNIESKETYSLPFNLISFYIQDNYQLTNNFSLTIGARYDNYSFLESNLNPRAAIVYSPFKNTAIKGLWGNAFRAPNLFEIKGQQEGFQIPSANLKPERINTFELVLEQRLVNDVILTTSIYNYKLNDMIEMIQLESSLFQYQNLMTARATGVEVEIYGKLTKSSSFYSNYAYSNGLIENETALNQPQHLLKFGFTDDFFEFLGATLEGYYESGRLTENRVMTDGFFLANLNFILRPQIILKNENDFWTNLSLQFKVFNLLDTQYEHPAPNFYRQNTIVQNGRSFRFLIGYKF